MCAHGSRAAGEQIRDVDMWVCPPINCVSTVVTVCPLMAYCDLDRHCTGIVSPALCYLLISVTFDFNVLPGTIQQNRSKLSPVAGRDRGKEDHGEPSAVTGETSFVTDQTSAVAAGKDNLGQTEISMDFVESIEIPHMPELGTYVIKLCRDSTADNCVFQYARCNRCYFICAFWEQFGDR